MAKQITKPTTQPIQFDNSFKESFDVLIDGFSKSIDKLNRVATGKELKSEYGVCSCSYHLRYITPNDVSTYVSNLIKAFENNLFHASVSDTEMFTVASVKRFIEDNGCPAFETSSALEGTNRYINPKTQTLTDLTHTCANDIGNVCIYSRGEMVKRLELMKDDIKKMNDMHFTATMKKIVASLPAILSDTDSSFILHNSIYRTLIIQFIQEFILFACTLNTIAVLQLISYADPAVEYTIKQKDENSNDIVTECCLIKTNDMIIQNKIPFNCNIRDVVLMDVTPNFGDVLNALKFIIHDARSPISILLNRFTSKDIDTSSESDCELVGRLLLGVKYYDDKDGSKWHTKTGEKCIDDPAKINGFKQKVEWLDTIAFGNNFLDGNYRRDAVGNNHVHPIVNTLDSLYKIYGGHDFKTNEDLAKNIVKVSSLMESIIIEYSNGNVENYDLTKDILVLLGEILTRNILHLYYNNTRVYAFDDSMPDAGTPGFICTESFVMEDGENKPNTQQKADTTKTTVSFTNQSGQQNKTNANQKISSLIQKFIQWVRNSLSKFSDNFNKNHKKEIDWIKNNMKLNEEIKEAINQKRFNPHVTNLPKFNIPASALTKPVMFDLVQQYADIEKHKELNVEELTRLMSGVDSNTMQNFKTLKDAAVSEAFNNYVLFGKLDKAEMYTGPLSAAQWEELYKDLIETPDLINKVSISISDDITKASEFLQKKLQQLEMASGDQAQKNQPLIQRCNELSKIVQNAAKLYKTPTLNNINGKFYSKNYTLYRDIITGYKQQNNVSGQTGTTNQTSDTNQTENVQTSNVPETK